MSISHLPDIFNRLPQSRAQKKPPRFQRNAAAGLFTGNAAGGMTGQNGR